jgi:hypothetical protein
VIIELLAAGIQSSLERRSSQIAPQLCALAVWLRDVSDPPPGAELHVPDGRVFSGITVVSSNRIVASVLLTHRGRRPAHGAAAPTSWRDADDGPLSRHDGPYR